MEGNLAVLLPGGAVKYAVEVEDREDGLLSHGDISAESVGFSISMVEAGFDPDELDAVGEEDPVLARFPVAAGLTANCRSCHLAQGRLVGPGFDRIAERYLGQADAIDGLVKKIVQVGVGSGVK